VQTQCWQKETESNRKDLGPSLRLATEPRAMRVHLLEHLKPPKGLLRALVGASCGNPTHLIGLEDRAHQQIVSMMHTFGGA